MRTSQNDNHVADHQGHPYFKNAWAGQVGGPKMDKSTRPATRQVPTTRGRPFAHGNPGRRLGSKNRTSLITAALLEGEAEELVRKAVEAALAGNIVMHKFLLGRILPRERLIKLDLPRLDFADDAVEAHSAIIRAVSEGRITLSEGAALATVVNSYTHAIDVADVVKRVDELEAKIKDGRAR